jgi:hypothetical protein
MGVVVCFADSEGTPEEKGKGQSGIGAQDSVRDMCS